MTVYPTGLIEPRALLNQTSAQIRTHVGKESIESRTMFSDY